VRHRRYKGGFHPEVFGPFCEGLTRLQGLAGKLLYSIAFELLRQRISRAAGAIENNISRLDVEDKKS